MLALLAVAAVALGGCGDGDARTDGNRERAGSDSGSVAAAAAADCRRPYADDSPWNTPIREEAAVLDRDLGIRGELSSSPEQYTYPVYYVSSATPRRTVAVSGWFSNGSSDW